MEMKVKDVSIEQLLRGAEYLGCGASKEAYLKDGIVYKIPRGRYVIKNGGFGFDLIYPSEMKEVDDFLETIYHYEEQMIWPIGQFAIELIVWEAIQTLRSEGLDINCFAEIKDYYLDRDGIPVIEQEETVPFTNSDMDYLLWDETMKELELLEPILYDRFYIDLRDVREGNCGVVDNKVKLFDFGISTTTTLDSYGSYSDYRSYDEDEEEW